MTEAPIELFYCYAPEDEVLCTQLAKRLASLQRQGLITQWHKGLMRPGESRDQQVRAHLQAARIIVVLVSPDLLASDSLYDGELREVLRRYRAGEASVIPVLLRPTSLLGTPFADFTLLPENGRPATEWPNRDAAFRAIAEGIGKVVQGLNGRVAAAPVEYGRKKKTSVKEGGVAVDMPPIVPSQSAAPAASGVLSGPVLRKAIDQYHKKLKSFEGIADYELALRIAFQNLLDDTSKHVNWKLIAEQTIEDGIRPDGVLRDVNNLRRGYWEAKGPRSDLEREIDLKVKKGYPLTNTLFENTRRAVLYQGKRRVDEYDLEKTTDVSDLLTQFLTYTEPHIEHFQTAVIEFKTRIPDLANDLLGTIATEHKQNARFRTAFASFAAICRASLNPGLTDKAIDEMLVQHLLTERLFRTVFQNDDFVNRNVIAAEIEKVIQALTARSFNRQEFFRSLDRYYKAIEGTAQGIESWTERQEFLNTVYEGFFQGFSTRQADTYGIVYTPQEIVDFMCASVDEVLKREFNSGLGEPGVQILDPATGTGNFIVNIIRHYITGRHLESKYRNDLFCNEIMLLPYYIASLNIEHEYYTRSKHYEPFEGICFADTLELAEGQQLSMFVEENTERVQREKDAQIMVVMGNPPYNVGQRNENDNNKNRRYNIVDQRVRETYVKGSKATNRIALSDVYVKFFRWATDRLQRRDGIVCFVSNNGFLEGLAFDGFRKYLAEDFTQIYHLDLGGNARKQGGGNVFGIMVGVGITIAVRSSQNSERAIYYYRVPEDWRGTEKLAFLKDKKTFSSIDWAALQPDARFTWITEGLSLDFSAYLPIGLKEVKNIHNVDVPAIFRMYSSGVKTNRDQWTYDFNRTSLEEKIKKFVETYSSDLDRWRRRGSNIVSVNDFVLYDDTKTKWSEGLKLSLQRNQDIEYDAKKIRTSLYRPFCKQWLFFDHALIERVYQQHIFFPTPETELENVVLIVGGYGRKQFAVLASSYIPDLNFYADPAQCFPYYTYAADGTARRENITDWSLHQFQASYGAEVSKWDIFHYVYGLLHHPQYRARYAENLKRDLPHIPLLHTAEAFRACVEIGRQLMELHLHYEQAEEYKLKWDERTDVLSTRVEKMRLSGDKRALVVNETLHLVPIPEECFAYRLGNRSALEWVIDQYQVSEDRRSGITSDPNREDDPEYIVRLVGQVVTVSVETVRLVQELAASVRVEDWV